MLNGHLAGTRDISVEGDPSKRAGQKYRSAATVDEKGNLLPGISAWARDLKEGAAHPGVMNYNFRLTFAKDPALQAPIPEPDHYDAARYRLLENWLRGKSDRDVIGEFGG